MERAAEVEAKLKVSQENFSAKEQGYLHHVEDLQQKVCFAFTSIQSSMKDTALRVTDFIRMLLHFARLLGCILSLF